MGSEPTIAATHASKKYLEHERRQRGQTDRSDSQYILIAMQRRLAVLCHSSESGHSHALVTKREGSKSCAADRSAASLFYWDL